MFKSREHEIEIQNNTFNPFTWRRREERYYNQENGISNKSSGYIFIWIRWIKCRVKFQYKVRNIRSQVTYTRDEDKFSHVDLRVGLIKTVLYSPNN